MNNDGNKNVSEFFKKNWIFFAIGGAVIVVVTIAIIIFSSLGKLDPSKYCEVTVKGLNGNGTVSLDVNSKSLTAAIMVKNTSMTNANATLGIASVISDVSYEIVSEKKADFKNGDKIKIKINYNKQLANIYKIKFSKDTFTYKITGLKDGRGIDPFNGLKVTFSGVSGKAKPTIDKSGCDSYVKDNVTFSASKTSGLSNGDKITVKISYGETKATENSIFFTSKTKDFTVDGTDEYVLSTDGVKFSDIDTSIQHKVEDLLKAKSFAVDKEKSATAIEAKGGYSATYKITKVDLTAVKKIFMDYKEPTSSYQNKYITVWKAHITAECTDAGSSTDVQVGQSSECDIYYTITASNVSMKSDKVVQTPSSFTTQYTVVSMADSASDFTSICNKLTDSNKDKYNIKELQ